MQLVHRSSFLPTVDPNAVARFWGPTWPADLLRAFGYSETAPAVAAWAPPADLQHTDEGYRLEVDLPGFTKEQVDISIDDNVLTLTGERRPIETPNGRYHRTERWYGKFSRSFSLPGNVDPAAIEARFENGVLTVFLPKLQEAQRRRVEIH